VLGDLPLHNTVLPGLVFGKGRMGRGPVGFGRSRLCNFQNDGGAGGFVARHRIQNGEESSGKMGRGISEEVAVVGEGREDEGGRN